MEVRCTLSHKLCLPEALAPQKHAQQQLGIGAVMALFDEVASYALMVQDRSRRSGVSVCLYSHLHQDIHAGTEVVIKARSVKNGTVLGFAEAVMEDANTGKLVRDAFGLQVFDSGCLLTPCLCVCMQLATSRLIKHLPLGLAYDLMMGPALLPYTVAWSEMMNRHPSAAKLVGRWITAARTSPVDPRSHPEINAYDAINVQDSQVLVHQDISNPLGYLHGGAVAMAAETALLQQVPEAASKVRRMKVEYMTAMKRQARFELDSSHQAADGSDHPEYRVRVSTYKGQPAAVATFS